MVRNGLPGAVARFFGIGYGWDRPLQRRRALRWDLVVALCYAAGALLSLETSRSLGAITDSDLSRGWQYLWIAVPALSLVVRRVLPLYTLALACAHLALTAWLAPELSGVFAAQFYYFFVLFTAVAWSHDRRLAAVMSIVFAAVTSTWVLAEVLVRDTLDPFDRLPDTGPFSPTVAAAISIALTSATLFCSTVGAGALTWRAAFRAARSREQALTIVDQADRLSEQAVTSERLRIARELHDVVGHHVAVIGIQTAAARRTFEVSPEQATTAMLQSEETARSATRDLRLILTALRGRDDHHDAAGPQPGLSSIDETIESFEQLGLTVELKDTGDLESVPMAVGLALHRILQESLTNVRRHSTADHVDVRLDVTSTGPDAGTASLTVGDNGRPRGGTSGSQVGLVGMRERALLHHGTLRTSTTATGGFEVAVNLEWGAE